MAKIVRIVVAAYVALVASVASLALVPAASAQTSDVAQTSVQRCYEDFACDGDQSTVPSDAWGWLIANAGL